MSPVALLKETERAIGPDVCAQHEELIVADKELKSMKQSAAGEEKSLAELERQNEAPREGGSNGEIERGLVA